jgi:carbon-monoxide dehydrogenase medium subunit
MANVPLIEAHSVADAIGALQEHGDEAKLVAGATAVTIMLRQRLLDPSALISIARVEGLRQISAAGGVLTIGALTTLAEIERSLLIKDRIPGLAEVFGVVGNIRVRCAATVGGIVAEADYASDPPCALLALDAQVVIAGPQGTRTVAFADFVLGFYETVLEPDEIVIAVQIPIPEPGLSVVYEKFRTRSSEDRPCVGVFAAVRLLADGSCETVRLAVGAASEMAERFADIEATAVGSTLDEALAAELASAYAERIDTLEDMRGSAGYRTQMIRVWGRRALLRAAQAGPVN